MIPPMARSGGRLCRPVGRRIVTAAGYGWMTTAGPGSAMSPGVGLPITTVIGFTARLVGAGTRARSILTTTGVRRWLDFSVSVGDREASDLDSATWAGSRWLRTSATARG